MTKRILITLYFPKNFPNNNEITLHPNNELLSENQTTLYDYLLAEEIAIDNLKNYVIIFRKNKEREIPQLYNKDYLPQLKGINPYSREEITEVFEVEVQDNTDGILGLTLSKRSYSEFNRPLSEDDLIQELRNSADRIQELRNLSDRIQALRNVLQLLQD